MEYQSQFMLFMKILNNTLGAWVTIDHIRITQHLLEYSSVDYVVFDNEHSYFTLSNLENHLNACKFSGVLALVRVGKRDFVFASKVLELGFDGLIFSTVDSVDYCEKIQDLAYYPPKGRRGIGLNSANKFGNRFDEYLQGYNSKTIIIAQIETKESINQIDKFINFGFSGFMIGPYDLSSSIGFPGDFTNDSFKSLLRRFESFVSKTEIDMMYHIVHPNDEEIRILKERGYNSLCIGTDFEFLRTGISKFFD